ADTVDLGTGRSIVNADKSEISKIVGGTLALGGNLLTLRTSGHEYTGATELGLPNMNYLGKLTLVEEGALHSTSEIRIAQFSTLRIDNRLGRTPKDRSDRIGDAIPIYLEGGTIDYQASDTPENGQYSTERFGDLIVGDGESQFATSGRAELVAKSLQRQGPGLFTTSAGVNVMVGQGAGLKFDEAPVLVNDMIGAWAFSGSDFATYSPQFGILPLYRTVTKVESFTAANATSHVNFFGAPPALTADRTIASLVSGFGGAEFDLGGRQLNIVSGGWHNQGSVLVRNGTLTAGGTTGDRELILHESNPVGSGTLEVAAAIVDNSGGAVGLTLSGRIVLSGANTYTGPTRVLRDNIRVVAAQAIPVGTDLELSGGTLTADFDATEPIVLGDVSVSQRGRFYVNNSLANPPSVNAARYDLEAGELAINLVGSGPVRKTTLGRAELGGNNQSFTGTVDVEEGILIAGSVNSVLSAPSALGTGKITVHAGALLVNGSITPTGSFNLLHGDIDLRGGELGMSRTADARFEGQLTVFDQATLSLYDAADGSLANSSAIMHIQSATTFANQATTRVVGAGTVSFDGTLAIGDQATVLNADATVQISGELTPLSNDSTLLVSGDKFNWSGSINVPADHKLTVRQAETVPTLHFNRSSTTLHGSGELVNSVIIEGGSELSPGDAIGNLTIDGNVTLGPRGRINWELGNVAAGPGVGWDLLTLQQGLDVTATAATPFEWSIDASTLTDFDPQAEYRWTVADAQSIRPFDTAWLSVDDASLRDRFELPANAQFKWSQTASQLQLIYTVRQSLGDFNNDGVFDVVDLELLTEQVLSQSFDLRFDLNADGTVDSADREVWVHDVRNTYFGDTNLDGQFSATDLILVFQAGLYEDDVAGNATWLTGDWNGDREFSSGDLVIAFQDGGFETGPRPSITAVPEPAAIWMALATLCCLPSAVSRRRRLRRGAVAVALLAGGTICQPSDVAAQESTWINTGVGLWHTTQNWSNGVANGAGQTAIFDTQPQASLILVDAPVTLEQLVFQLPRTLQLSGDVPITFDSTSASPPQIVLSNGTGPLSMSTSLRNDSTEPLVLHTGDAALLELKGMLDAATFDLHKTGAGTLQLSGANASWGGALQIDAGTVEALTDTALGTTTGATTVGPGGTLLLVGNRNLNDSIQLTGGTLGSNAPGTARLGGSLIVDVDSEIKQTNVQGTLQLTGALSGNGQLSLTQGSLDLNVDAQPTGSIRVADGHLSVSKTLSTALQVDGGLVDMKAAGNASGPLHLNGGVVQFYTNSTSVYGGRVFLQSGELKPGATQTAVIRGVTVEAANDALISTGLGQFLSVQGGVDGAGDLSVANNGTLTFLTQPLTFAGDFNVNGKGTTAVSVPLNIGGTVMVNGGELRLTSTGSAPISMMPNTTLTIDNLNNSYSGSIQVTGQSKIMSHSGGTVSGAIQLSDASLEMRINTGSLNVTAPISGTGSLHLFAQDVGTRINASGGIQLQGDLIVEGIPSADVTMIGASTISGNLTVIETPLTFSGPLQLAGDLTIDSTRPLTFNSSGSKIDGAVIANQPGFLTINADTTFNSLHLSNGVRLQGTGGIHVGGTLTAGYSELNLTGVGIIGATNVEVSGEGPVRIGGLGAGFTGDLRLNEGLVTLTTSNALGQGSVTFTGANATLDARGVAIANKLNLNNARGYQSTGALMAGDFTGDIDLGDDSANLGGEGILNISGSLSGGGFTVLRPRVGNSNSIVNLSGSDHTLTGEIHMQGNLFGQGMLSLRPTARLSTPSQIVIEPFGKLEVKPSTETIGVPDQLADSIPLVMHGGDVELYGYTPVGERLGPVSIKSGSNRVFLSASDTSFTWQSLELGPMATLLLHGVVSAGENSPFRNELHIDGFAQQDFLGGGIVTREPSMGLTFARYDEQLGIVPLSPDAFAADDPATWTATSHVAVAGDVLLTTDQPIRSLTMNMRLGEMPILQLDGHLMNIESGGLALSGSTLIGGGRLTAGGSSDDAVLLLNTFRDYSDISADIVDNPGPDGQYEPIGGAGLNADNGRVSVVKAGDGVLRIAGNNTYSGDTWINDGVLRVENANAIPTTSNVYVLGAMEITVSIPMQPQSMTLRGGVINGGTIETPLLVLESGEFLGQLTGDGKVIKRTDSSMAYSAPLEFSGLTRIEQGTLDGKGTFGSGITVVEPAGALSGSVRGKVELHGGTLRNQVRLDDPSDTIEGWLHVVADSYINSDPGSVQNDVTILSSVVVNAGTTLNKTGVGDLTLGDSITLGDAATIRVNGGSSQFSYFNSFIEFGADATIDVTDGVAFVFGGLTPAKSNSRLHLIGDATFNVDVSVDLKAGRRLTLDQNDTVVPLTISGGQHYLRGDGVIANDVTLSNRAELRPGTTIGTLTVDGNLTVERSTSLHWDLHDAMAQAGTAGGWDLLTVEQTLNFRGGQTNAFFFDISGVDEMGNAAAVKNFNQGHSQQWVLMTANEIVGFNPAHFPLRLTGFDTNHPLPRGAKFSITQDANRILLNYDVLLGDVNLDRKRDGRDFDRLSDLIRSGSNDLTYDVNFDNTLDAADRSYWVEQIMGTWF
ncbi:MAG: autotransporter-associated beta strand repeat-containing protein, partial [Planctomycetales bacterium]|nr:autotransporter-associated beta strand repeat-containing protein [Planctomycetales bacterium]